MGTLGLPEHYRCTITCAFCGKRRHYEDECYHKQRLSAKLKSETQNGSVKGTADKGKGRGKHAFAPVQNFPPSKSPTHNSALSAESSPR